MSFIIFQNEKTPFQAIKKRSRKSGKIDIFPKGLTHGFGPKMAIFPFFLGNLGQENVFYDILKKKTPFQAINTRSSKIRKIDILPKGLTHGFGPKNGHFSNLFVFRQDRPGKCLLRYSKTKKNAFLVYKNKLFKKSKIDIFPKGLTHGFVQKWPFFQLFFYAIQERKMSLTIFKSEKTPLNAIKTRDSNRRKIDIFLKGLTHGFGPKMAIFPTFFLGNIGHENVFYDILEQKKRLSRL